VESTANSVTAAIERELGTLERNLGSTAGAIGEPAVPGAISVRHSKSVVCYGRLNGVDGMWRVPIERGDPQRINLNVGPIFSWRFNAKTGQVAFSTNGPGPRYEVWKMENFLPTSRSTR
jgi:hypothetical protein